MSCQSLMCVDPLTHIGGNCVVVWCQVFFHWVLSSLAFLKIGVKFAWCVTRLLLLSSGKGHVTQPKSVSAETVFIQNVTKLCNLFYTVIIRWMWGGNGFVRVVSVLSDWRKAISNVPDHLQSQQPPAVLSSLLTTSFLQLVCLLELVCRGIIQSWEVWLHFSLEFT